MPRLIIVSGPPGSGKTHLAKLLSQAISAPCFCKDDIKERLFDTLGWSDKQWSQKLGAASMKLLYYSADQILSAGGDVILEANFQSIFDIPHLNDLVQKHTADILEFHCQAPQSILLERITHRQRSNKRHPGHGDDQPGLANSTMKKHENMAIGKVILVDTSNFSQVDYVALVDLAQKFLTSTL